MYDFIHRLNRKLGPFVAVFWWCAGVCAFWLLWYLATGDWPQLSHDLTVTSDRNPLILKAHAVDDVGEVLPEIPPLDLGHAC